MSRALYRGQSTPERVRAHFPTQEPESPTEARDEHEIDERIRSRPVWEGCFPHFMRLWIKENLPISSPSHKCAIKPSEPGSKSWKIGDTPAVAPSVNYSVGSNCFSVLSCNGKSSPILFLPVFLLFLIGAFVLISLAGWNRPVPRLVFPPYNYPRAQLLAWRDLLRGGILGRGSLVSDPREVVVCPTGMEDYMPCYNVTANLEAGLTDGRQFEPHCEKIGRMHCLVPPPKGYRILSKWPDSSVGVWLGNLQIDNATGGNRLLVEETELKFPAKYEQTRNASGDHLHVAEILGFSGVTDFSQAKIRTILDIGCGLGSLGAHLWEHGLLTLCVAPYEEHGAQVQITLERGLPAMVGSLVATQLPYPSSAYDLVHCAECGIRGNLKDGLRLFEIDRLLRVGGYFVWAIPAQDGPGNRGDDALRSVQNFTTSLGWELASPFQHNALAIWQKKAPQTDLMIKNDQTLLCEHDGSDADWIWHQPLRPCITIPPGYRQTSVQDQLLWPLRLQLADTKADKSGPVHDESTGETNTWTGTVADYWSLLTPIIYSDHPKRLRDADIGPSGHLVRNMMDMNAGHGELNAALIMSRKEVWVMNVIPTSAANTLPFIFDRGLIGAVHDWCEPFPTYPRTYDFLHAANLLSQELKRPNSCGLANLFLDMDRILRPEGWVFLRDLAPLIDDARAVTNQMRWESRLIEVLDDKEQRLLVCQKTFWKA